MRKVEDKTSNEECTEHWSWQHFRNSIERPINTLVLSEFGWKVNKCGHASKRGYIYLNSGTLICQYCNMLPLEVDEWIEEEEIINGHPIIYQELLKTLP